MSSGRWCKPLSSRCASRGTWNGLEQGPPAEKSGAVACACTAALDWSWPRWTGRRRNSWWGWVSGAIQFQFNPGPSDPHQLMRTRWQPGQRHLVARQHNRQTLRRLRLGNVIEPRRFHAEHLFVQKQNRTLGLILRRRRHVADNCFSFGLTIATP